MQSCLSPLFLLGYVVLIINAGTGCNVSELFIFYVAPWAPFFDLHELNIGTMCSFFDLMHSLLGTMHQASTHVMGLKVWRSYDHGCPPADDIYDLCLQGRCPAPWLPTS